MSTRSVYVPDPRIESGRIQIAGDEHRHLAVARAREGEALEIVDGKGSVWSAVIRTAGRRETVAEITGTRQAAPDSCQLVLGLALVRSSAFELAIEKSVEAGVHRIVPFAASRSNTALPAVPDRWKRIVVEAAKQSKRYHFPVLEDPVRFDALLAQDARTKIVLAERGGGALKPVLAGSPVLYLVGPEGGWTGDELDKARGAGFSPVGLGERILRCETAAIVATALIRYEMDQN